MWVGDHHPLVHAVGVTVATPQMEPAADGARHCREMRDSGAEMITKE